MTNVACLWLVVAITVAVFTLSKQCQIETVIGQKRTESFSIVKRSVGGREVDISEHPYQVSLRRQLQKCEFCEFVHFCGATIYSLNGIITSAHCVDKITMPAAIRVVAGSNTIYGDEGVHIHVDRIIIHEGYVKRFFDNDIAILILQSNLPANNLNIAPIKLADYPPRAGDLATLTGWGAKESGGRSFWQLLVLKIPITDYETCRSSYYQEAITDAMLCAGGGVTGACQGDSGGPLVVNDELVGIVSWGYGCARPGFPGIFTNVAKFVPWVQLQFIAANPNFL